MLALLTFLIFPLMTPASASINWRDDLPSTLEAAKAKNELVLLDFAATWCYSCQYMNQHVLGEPEMDSFASKIEFVRLDVDSVEGAKLEKQFLVRGLPNYVILDPAGEEVGRIVGEQNKDAFFGQLRDIIDRNSPLSRLEAETKSGTGPQAVKAAAELMHAYSQQHEPKKGLDLYEGLSPELKRGIEEDSEGRAEFLRLQLLSAYDAKDAASCEKFGRLLMDGRNDCELGYDAYYLQHCFDRASPVQRRRSFAYQRKPIEALLAKGVFGKPAERCPDLQTAAEIATSFYQAVGEKKQVQRLLSRLIDQTKAELGGDLSRDRNKADNLLDFLDLAKQTKEMAALYPRLVTAYPKDYVYPYLYGAFLLEHNQPAQALASLDGAKKLAYGAGVLRVAISRAKALAKLGRKGDARAELDAAMKTDVSAFPKEAAELAKTRQSVLR